MSAESQREHIVSVLRDMQGNATMATAEGRTAAGKLQIKNFSWFEYPAELDLMVKFAVEHEDEDVYLSPIIYGDMPFATKSGVVIEKDYRGRKIWSRSKDNALWSQTVYMDSDSCPPEAFRLPPSRHLDTSEGHGHDYWYLNEPVTAMVAAEVAHRITTAHKAEGSDPSGWSANKVLRMPTVNTSYDEVQPFEIKTTEAGQVYDIADISGAYDDITIETLSDSIKVIEFEMPGTDELLPFIDLVNKIPETERRLQDLIFHDPAKRNTAARSEQRYALLLDLLRFGFNPLETLSVAWASPAAQKWREDERGIEGLKYELLRAMAVIAEERGDSIPAAPLKPLRKRAPKLLNDDERRHFAEAKNFITDYMGWGKSKVPVFNAPLHSINAWVALSLAFGDAIYIPKPGGPMPCNFYTTTIADSGSGKTEAKSLLWQFKAAQSQRHDPDIGGVQHKNALIEQLLEKRNRVALSHDGEAHGALREMKTQGWATGLQDTWTNVYDGPVPMIGKVGKSELRVTDAWVCHTMHMIGTPGEMYSVIDRGMFLSGYAARQIWTVADEIAMTREDMNPMQVIGDVVKTYERMPRYWANQFRKIKAQFRANIKMGQSKVPMYLTDEAAKRFGDAKWEIKQHFEKLDDWDLFRPSIIRMSDIIWKAAALIAASNGRQVIGTKDITTALGSAESWLADLIRVSEGIASTAFAKACDDIEKFISLSKGREAERSSIYRKRSGEPPRITDEYLQSLVRQGRIHEEKNDAGGPVWYRMKTTDHEEIEDE